MSPLCTVSRRPAMSAGSLRASPMKNNDPCDSRMPAVSVTLGAFRPGLGASQARLGASAPLPSADSPSLNIVSNGEAEFGGKIRSFICLRCHSRSRASGSAAPRHVDSSRTLGGTRKVRTNGTRSEHHGIGRSTRWHQPGQRDHRRRDGSQRDRPATRRRSLNTGGALLQLSVIFRNYERLQHKP